MAHSVLAGDCVTVGKMLQSNNHVNINLKNMVNYIPIFLMSVFKASCFYLVRIFYKKCKNVQYPCETLQILSELNIV